MAKSNTTTKDRRQNDGDEGRSTVTTTEEQETLVREMERLESQRDERLDTLEQRLDNMPDLIVGRLRAVVADRPPEEVKRAVTEVMEEKVEGNAFMRGLRWTGHALKPRKPRQEDVFPVIASNVVTWGGAFALSQVSGGVSDALCDLFSQAAENGIDAV